MARQQYNNRQISGYSKGAKYTPPPRNQRRPSGGAWRMPNTRNEPRNRKSEQHPDWTLQEVMVDWVLNELDPWFYKAMKFNCGMTNHVVISGREQHRDNTGYMHMLGSLMFTPDRVVIWSSSTRRRRTTDELEPESKHILYTEPDLFDLIQTEIRFMYNNG